MRQNSFNWQTSRFFLVKAATTNVFITKRDCPIKDDDVPEIWKKLNAADAVIFGVPVYSGTIPSLLKILFERS